MSNVDINVDRRTDGWTDGRTIGCLYRTLLQAGAIKMEITPKVRKAELSFLYATCCLVLFYISAKFHQNIPKGIRVTKRTRNLFQINKRVITPKVRKPELSILYATYHLVLIYNSTKYHQNIPKGIRVTERTRSFTPTPKNNMSPPPPPFGRWRHNMDVL